jgi:hypothetical protein
MRIEREHAHNTQNTSCPHEATLEEEEGSDVDWRRRRIHVALEC